MNGIVTKADPAETRIEFDNGERFITTLPKGVVKVGDRVRIVFGPGRDFRMTKL